MLICTNPFHQGHHGQAEMYRGRLVPCHETPDRLHQVQQAIEAAGLGPAVHPAMGNPAFEAALGAVVAKVHTRDYLDFLSTAWPDWVALDPENASRDALPSVWPLPVAHGFRADRPPQHWAARLGQYAFDSGTPLTAGSWTAAWAGAGCALTAAQAVLAGARSALALTRPPGHHAGPNFMGGYCFINNGAVAAQALRDGGHARVAVLDIDFHHGNGTQTIFYERADVFTASLHGDPQTEYPFYLGHADETGAAEGQGTNLNRPLPRGTTAAVWLAALADMVDQVSAWRPSAVVVPLGLDTFAGDPIAGFGLQSTDYPGVGRLLARLPGPTVFTLEGGYATADLGTNAVGVLQGFLSSCGANP